VKNEKITNTCRRARTQPPSSSLRTGLAPEKKEGKKEERRAPQQRDPFLTVNAVMMKSLCARREKKRRGRRGGEGRKDRTAPLHQRVRRTHGPCSRVLQNLGEERERKGGKGRRGKEAAGQKKNDPDEAAGLPLFVYVQHHHEHSKHSAEEKGEKGKGGEGGRRGRGKVDAEHPPPVERQHRKKESGATRRAVPRAAPPGEDKGKVGKTAGMTSITRPISPRGGGKREKGKRTNHKASISYLLSHHLYCGKKEGGKGGGRKERINGSTVDHHDADSFHHSSAQYRGGEKKKKREREEGEVGENP